MNRGLCEVAPCKSSLLEDIDESSQSEIKTYSHLVSCCLLLFLRCFHRGLDCKYTKTLAVLTSQQIVSLPRVRNIIVHVHAPTSSSAVLDDLSGAKVSQEGYV